MRILFISALLLCFIRISFSQTLVINEFLANNDTTIADQNEEFDDWIELYNNSGNSISLNEYYLSDDFTDLTKWAFPDTIIGVDEYLIIWADDDSNQIGLHANFKLSASGENIYLVGPDTTTIADEISFGAQTADISTGRYPNGTGDFIIMRPTFSVPNTNEDLSPEDDTSELIFEDSKIHKYELHFYVVDWADSLSFNYENGEAYMPARLTYNDSLVLDSIGVRYKGNSSYILSSNTLKKPFKFKFDKYKNDQLFYGVNRLNFSNCISDPSFMREKIAYDISRRYMPAPRTVYSNIYIEGNLIGLYVQVEQVDKIFLDRYFENNGYNLYKSSDDGASLEYRGAGQSNYESEYDLKTNEEENDWSGLITMIENLNNTPDSSFVTTMRQYLNLDNCLRLLAFNMVFSNFDSYTGSGRNFYLYDDQNYGQFSIIPWDLNESFGAYTNNWDAITQDVINISNLSQRSLNRRILQNDSLRQVYLDYISEMINGPASYDSISAIADQIMPLIDNYVQADNNKLYSYQNFVDNIENDVSIDLGRIIPGIKSFSQSRNANLLTQLSSDEVYPGDTDNNGVVNANDILPIGSYFLNEGSERDSTSFFWRPQQSLFWDIPAETYADANGDGIIDENDVIGIGVNWGNTHTNTTMSFEVNLTNTTLLNQYEDNYRTIYNSLSGGSEAVVSMKKLLESFLSIDEIVPASYSLEQNYPNPFNPETTIRFALPEKQNVTLAVYTVLGQKISVPINNKQYEAGRHEITFDASSFASGIYIYHITSDYWSDVRKMVVLK